MHSALPVDFDLWRARYAELDDFTQKAVWHVWAERYPAQDHANRAAAGVFFATIPAAARVVEIGGWRGALAVDVLASRPDLASWLNIEFCHLAASTPVCDDPRFDVWEPAAFRWWQGRPFPDGDVVVATHAIEHLSDADAFALLTALPTSARALYLEAPLPAEGPTSWGGYEGSHILSWGWRELGGVLGGCGWRAAFAVGDARGFTR